MDVIGILKEAWAKTWLHKKLWILGLFVAGSSSVSSFNWQTGGSTESQGWENWDGTWNRGPDGWEGPSDAPEEITRAIEDVEHFFQTSSVGDWLPWVLLGIAALIVIGIFFWVLSIAARGGLIDQTNEALAGREVSVRAGWRTGFRRFGRVFLVGLLLALPLILVGGLSAALVAGVSVFFFAGAAEVAPGLLSLGVLVPFIILVMITLGVAIALITEVSYRHAVLGDLTALEAIKAAWADLTGKRGVATMWVVMLVVGLGAAVAAGILMIPLLIVVGLVVGAAVVGAGLEGLWLLLPLGLLVTAAGAVVKAIYSTFYYAAWTEFYRRMMNGELRKEPVEADETTRVAAPIEEQAATDGATDAE